MANTTKSSISRGHGIFTTFDNNKCTVNLQKHVRYKPIHREKGEEVKVDTWLTYVQTSHEEAYVSLALYFEHVMLFVAQLCISKTFVTERFL